MNFARFKASPRFDWLVLTIISALAYLPFVYNFGYFNDDWYLMYAAHAQGAGVFTAVYSIDRPLRALVMAPAYTIFGGNPLYYNLSAYLFRLLGAFALLWSLRMLWPRQRSATLLIALLFLIYPGFLSQPNAIDYQAQQVSLFLAPLSIALSVKAVLSQKSVTKIVLAILSAVTAWLYLGFVEYFLGLEALRLLFIGTIVWREQIKTLWKKLWQTFVRWLPYAIGPASFLIWRVFLFHSERKATDVGAQLGKIAASPVLIGVQWMIALIQGVFKVIALAWELPLYNLMGLTLRLREIALGGLIVLLSGLLAVWAASRDNPSKEASPSRDWRREAMWIGWLSAVAGLTPIVLANRQVDFSAYSRYTLASSIGAAIIVIAFLSYVTSRRVRIVAVSLLVIIASLTHYLNGIQAAKQTDAIRQFWWETAWRAPQLRTETTLVANYASSPIEEDYFVWGPANLIYYPQSTDPQRLKPGVAALVLNRENLQNILLTRGGQFSDRRSALTNAQYGNILILSKPTPDSCVQVIDGSQPELSASEQYDIQLIASYSNIQDVTTDGLQPTPPEVVFGSEPPHGWCYYYEKASLARQRGDWVTVLSLAHQVKQQDISATDAIEWMPFLQAYVHASDEKGIYSIAPKVKTDPVVVEQACRTLPTTPGITPEMTSFVQQVFCQPSS
jgi:hypothetical protein